jgi:hypothetical protein
MGKLIAYKRLGPTKIRVKNKPNGQAGLIHARALVACRRENA